MIKLELACQVTCVYWNLFMWDSQLVNSLPCLSARLFDLMRFRGQHECWTGGFMLYLKCIYYQEKCYKTYCGSDKAGASKWNVFGVVNTSSFIKQISVLKRKNPLPTNEQCLKHSALKNLTKGSYYKVWLMKMYTISRPIRIKMAFDFFFLWSSLCTLVSCDNTRFWCISKEDSKHVH